MDEQDFNKKVDDRIRKVLGASGFISRKITDMPTDSLQAVPRQYVTLNGTVSNRPKSSVATVGQPYLATDTAIPMTYTTAGWVNGVGSIVALNN